MIPDTNGNRRKKITAFSVVLLATVGIATLLAATVWQKETNKPEGKKVTVLSTAPSTANYAMLLTANAVLASRLNTLQQLDNQYADQLTTSNNKQQLDSINQLIYTQEDVFGKSIDSILYNLPVQQDTALTTFQSNFISLYKSILGNRHNVNSLRTMINIDEKELNPDEMAMLKNQKELQEKNSRIASLENTLKAMSLNNRSTISMPEANADNNIKLLTENIAAQQNTIGELTNINTILKQNNDKLVKQQHEALTNANYGEIAFKNKTTFLQQKVDILSAELRLARVDCNLSRVDAAQIISNAKQRKQLLSEASGILTGLANTDDADIKKKVQDKIVLLKQIAANSRD